MTQKELNMRLLQIIAQTEAMIEHSQKTIKLVQDMPVMTEYAQYDKAARQSMVDHFGDVMALEPEKEQKYDTAGA